MAHTVQPTFDRPLTIADPVGNIEINSADEALTYLESAEWPNQQRQEEARLAAQSVLDGQLTSSEARESFAAAAERAGILVFN